MMFCGFFEEASRLHETNPPKLTKEFQAFSGAWGTRPRWGVLSKSLHQPPLKFPPLQEAFRNIVGRLLEAWQRECLEDWKFLPCGDVFRACRQHTPNSIGTLNTWNRSSKRVERAWTCKYHICSGSSHRGAHAFNVVRFPDVSLFFVAWTPPRQVSISCSYQVLSFWSTMFDCRWIFLSVLCDTIAISDYRFLSCTKNVMIFKNPRMHEKQAVFIMELFNPQTPGICPFHLW